LNPVPGWAEQLRALGVGVGTTALVRVGLRSLGVEAALASGYLISAFQEATDGTGTVVTPAHTGFGYTFRRRRAPVFSPSSRSKVGGFSNALLDIGESKRSSHPTHSIVCLGPMADEIVSSHTHSSTCFGYLKALHRLDAIQLSVGTAYSKSGPGFLSVDRSLERLGLTNRSLLLGLTGAKYHCADGSVKWFTRWDVPGCSKGFSRLYENYDQSGLLRRGLVGQAETLAISVRDAMTVERSVLEANPTAVICRNAGCVDCALKLYNWRSWPRFVRSRLRVSS